MEINASKYKIVAVLNKKLETGVALNAIAHMGLGLSASVSEEIREEMSFIDFPDKDGVIHPCISALSLIVLKGTAGKVKTTRGLAKEAGLHVIDFLETMTGETYKEQLEKTATTNSQSLNYYGIIIFGEKEKIDPITQKLSLWM